MTVSAVLDAADRRRSPATSPGYHSGRPPRNKGQLYPADPPTVEEIIAVMRRAPDDRHGARLRALIVVLWHAGSASRRRSCWASATSIRGGARCSCVGARAAVGERSAWTPGAGSSCRPGSGARIELPVGPLFCIIDGPTQGRSWSSAGVRSSSVGLLPRRVSGVRDS